MIEHWGLRGELRRLPGERDENYLVDGRHVLKISRDGRALLEAQTRVLDRLASTGLTQEVVATLRGERLVTNGGRILGVTGTGATLTAAREQAYAGCERIRFDGVQYRRDIALAAAAAAG